jgi:hypothetical protein
MGNGRQILPPFIAVRTRSIAHNRVPIGARAASAVDKWRREGASMLRVVPLSARLQLFQR